MARLMEAIPGRLTTVSRLPACDNLELMTRNFPVLLHPGDDGFVLAECPAIPGCFTQGRTKKEALSNIREVIELALGSGDPTLPITVEGWELEAVPVSVPT